MSPPLIGIVTVTYNSASFLDEFVASCAAQQGPTFRVYCIDNDSRDDTAKVLARIDDPRWVVTLNRRNGGVAEGNNQGIAQALEDGCEWVLLLNNDTTFEPDFFQQLVDACATRDWRVVVPKIHFDEPSGRIWYGGGGFNSRRGHTGYHTGIGTPDVGQFDTVGVVDYSPTCAMLVHRSVFTQVGLMDETYFVYFDDTDFCWRLRQADIAIGYWPKTVLVHKVGGSTGGGTSPFGAYMTARNRLYFIKKHLGALSALAWIPVFVLYYVARYLVAQRSWACFHQSIKGTMEYATMQPNVPQPASRASARYALPHLVLVTSRFPWPLDHGFVLRIYWQTRLLSQRYRVTLHVVSPTVPTPESLATLSPWCDRIVTHRLSRVRMGWSLLKAVVSGAPLQVALFSDPAAQSAIDAALKTADAALSIAARTAGYIHAFKGPRFVDLADSLGQSYALIAQNSRQWLRKRAYATESVRIRAYEQQLARESTACFMFNPAEAATLGKFGNVVVVPHGVSERLFEVAAIGTGYAEGVVLFGKMNYGPNIDSAKWFVQHVLPLLQPGIKLYIVGSQPTEELIAMASADSRIVVTGFVDDPYPDIRGSIATVCPIRIGAGIQNKVIESLAVGAPAVISPLAAIPFSAIEKSGLIVCDEPAAWADAIHGLASRPDVRRAAVEAGRPYARAHFSWQAFAQAIDNEISAALAARQPSIQAGIANAHA